MADGIWTEGFYAGVCSALASVDECSTEYREIVRACGGADLLSFAMRTHDLQLENIRAVWKDSAQRNRRTTRV